MFGKLKLLLRKNTILKSFLLPHIFALIVPIVLISVIMFQINFNLYKNEISERSKGGIESVRQIMELETDGFMHLAGKIFSDSELLTAKTVSTETLKLYQSKLTGYLGANNFIAEIALYTPELDYMFSSLNSMSLNRYFEIMYEPIGYSADLFREFVNSDEKIIRIPIRQRVRDNKDIYAYVIKETAVYSSSNRVAVFMLDADYISSIMKNIEGDAYIFDGNGYCVASSTLDYGISPESIRPLFAQNNEKLNFEGNTYYVNSVRSESIDWNYVLVSDYRDTYKNLLSIQWIYTILLLIIVLSGILAMVYSVRKIYHPIRSLAQRLEQSQDETNELETIDKNINNLVKTKDDLEKQVETAYTIAREYLFYKLINGEFSSREEISGKFSFYNVTFDYPYYYIALFEIEDFEAELVADVLKLLEEYTGEYNCFSVSVFDNRKFCVLCPSLSEKHTEENHQLLFQMQRFLEELMMSRVTVGVGNPVGDVSTVWKSYIEAKSAGDYKKIKGSGKILLFCDISTEYDKDRYVYPDMKKIPAYIKAGETKETFEVIDKIITSLSDAPLTVSQCVCFELMLVILQAVSETAGSDREDLYLSRFDITALVNFESIQALSCEVKKFLEEVFCDLSRETSETDSFIDRIVEYIKENYNSPYFSVEQVARHFEVSTTYLGQYFKVKKAMTVSAYIAKVQMDNAKRILLETSKTVKEIADEIGYTDVSNFIRRFKALTGITPGLYRKAHKKTDKI